MLLGGPSSGRQPSGKTMLIGATFDWVKFWMEEAIGRTKEMRRFVNFIHRYTQYCVPPGSLIAMYGSKRTNVIIFTCEFP